MPALIDHKTIWINTQTKDTISGEAGGQAYALRAGTSLNCEGYEYKLSNIQEAIKAGILSKGVIDRALTSVFTIRMRTGEFAPPFSVPYNSITKEEIQSPAHQKLAEEVAENALVLLKNDPVSNKKKQLLPLNLDKLQNLLILGNLANKVTLGGYSGDPTLQINAVEGITNVFKTINPSINVKFDNTNTSTTSVEPVILNEKIKSDIKKADAIIVFIGTNEAVASEGHDRASLAIPGNYGSLIYQVAEQGNKNMILVIQSDGPLNINYIQNYFSAILFSGYNGESQGTALANVLVDKKNPSGHLDFTWYMNDDQLADKSDYYLTPFKTNGLGHTYQYLTKKPLYPFGYGLSYTQFKFGDLKVSSNQISPDDSVIVSFDITNTGNLPGADVAQLYVTYPKIKGIDLPIKRLKGFRKTKILKPNQTEHILLTVKGIQLSNWNEQDKKEMVYNGDYQFQLGKDSRDIVDSQTVNIEGKLTPKIMHVTIEPENLVYHVGEELDLKGKNRWIESDVIPARQRFIPQADHIIEAVNNDESFADLSKAEINYKSSNDAVAQVTSDGIVRFIAPGVVTISASIDGVTGSSVFVVKKTKE
ncbi:MAG: glycoside hydrolase family 3 C-terminal domain-containing protein [Chitinophagaceae bacterium]